MAAAQNSFALDLSGDGMALFHRHPTGGWEEVERVPLQLSSLTSDLALLREAVALRGGASGEVTVWMPFDQVRLAAPDQELPNDHVVDSAPPRKIEMAEGAPAPTLPKAIIPRATLLETDSFLREHGFKPLRFSTRYPLAETGTHPVFHFQAKQKLPLVPLASAAAVVLGLGLGGLGLWSYLGSGDKPPAHQAFSPGLGWYEGSDLAQLNRPEPDVPHGVAVTQFLAEPAALTVDSFTRPRVEAISAHTQSQIAALTPLDLGLESPEGLQIATQPIAFANPWSAETLLTSQNPPAQWGAELLAAAPARLDAPNSQDKPALPAISPSWSPNLDVAALASSGDPLLTNVSAEVQSTLSELPLRWDWTLGTASSVLDQDPVGEGVQTVLVDESPRIWSLLARSEPFSGSEQPQIAMAEVTARARVLPSALPKDRATLLTQAEGLDSLELSAITEIAQAHFDAIARAEAAQPLAVSFGQTLSDLPQITSAGGRFPGPTPDDGTVALFAAPTAAPIQVAAVNPTALLDPFEFLPREARPVRVISEAPSLRPVPRPEGLVGAEGDEVSSPVPNASAAPTDVPRTPPAALVAPASLDPETRAAGLDALRPAPEPEFPNYAPPRAPLELGSTPESEAPEVTDRLLVLLQPEAPPFMGLVPQGTLPPIAVGLPSRLTALSTPASPVVVVTPPEPTVEDEVLPGADEVATAALPAPSSDDGSPSTDQAALEAEPSESGDATSAESVEVAAPEETPEGSPQVVAARPDIVPPARPEALAEAALAAAVQAEVQAALEAAQAEALAPTERAITRAGRPLARPIPEPEPEPAPQETEVAAVDPDAAAERAIAALASTGRAILSSERPRSRPEGLQPSRVTVRTQPQSEPQGITTITRTAPALPTTASVARAATQPDALPSRGLVLIGVYGTTNSRHALVRTRRGKFETIRRGDVIDGFQVSAIGLDTVRVRRGGKDQVLRLPN